MELLNQSFVSPCQESSVEQSLCSNSDSVDFLGFDDADLKNEIVNASTGEVYIVFGEMENNLSQNNQSVPKEADDDVIIMENNVEVIEIDENQKNLSDPKETDDELIIVENNVEVIEIDDDDDEVILFAFA